MSIKSDRKRRVKATYGKLTSQQLKTAGQARESKRYFSDLTEQEHAEIEAALGVEPGKKVERVTIGVDHLNLNVGTNTVVAVEYSPIEGVAGRFIVFYYNAEANPLSEKESELIALETIHNMQECGCNFGIPSKMIVMQGVSDELCEWTQLQVTSAGGSFLEFGERQSPKTVC